MPEQDTSEEALQREAHNEEIQRSDGIDVESTMRLLIVEHRATIAVLVSSRLFYRVLLFSIVLFHAAFRLVHWWQEIPVFLAAVLVIASWCLDQFKLSRQLDRVGDLVSQAIRNERATEFLVMWRFETRFDSLLERIQRFEPLIWFLFISIVMIL
jgi:hypothetical protein